MNGLLDEHSPQEYAFSTIFPLFFLISFSKINHLFNVNEVIVFGDGVHTYTRVKNSEKETLQVVFVHLVCAILLIN